MKVLIIIKWLFIGFCNCQNELSDLRWPTSQDKVMLVNTNNKNHNLLNKKFKTSLQRTPFYDLEIEDVVIENNTMMNVIDQSKKHRNIINLKVSTKTDYKDHIEMIKEFHQSNLMCLRNCNFLESVEDDAVIVLDTTRNSCKRGVISRKEYSNKHATIISDSILNYEKIMKIIEDLTTAPETPKVLICLPKPNIHNNELKTKLYEDNVSKIELTVRNCDDDIEVDHYTAVIANRPLGDYSNVPTIFYQTPFAHTEYEADFPNSVNLSPNWHTLKYAFVNFFNHLNLKRVAVVSDDSENRHFANELVDLFRRDSDFVFTTEQCEGRNCDFLEVLKKLHRAEAKIIILNIDSKYSEKLVSAVKDVGMRDVTWLVREWPFKEFRNPLLSDMYAFIQYRVDDNNHDSRAIVHYDFLSRILQIIKTTYKNYDSYDFKREFVDKLRAIEYSGTSITRVTRLSRGRSAKVADISVTGTISKMHGFKLAKKEIPDVPEACLLRGYNFFNPCQYGTLMLFIGVLIMFALLQLIIMIFFDHYRTQRPYRILE